MIGATRTLVASVDSLRLRLAILLTIGILAASAMWLSLSGTAHQRHLQRLRLESVVESVQDIREKLDTDPVLTERLLRADLILGARRPRAEARIDDPAPDLTRLLRANVGPDAEGQAADYRSCFPMHFAYNERAFDPPAGFSNCWLVGFRDKSGKEQQIYVGLPSFLSAPDNVFDPVYVGFILLASMALASAAAYFATKPLKRLTLAAEAFSLSEEPEALPEGGPREVRTAIATFNMMQRRVKDGHRERTSMLAAISHDLQTPLTRLRLRVDEVADDMLRERLIADLSSTQSLVREGLDLARSTENFEPWSTVDIDSLVAATATDAADLGADVTVGSLCELAVRTKLDALTRCLANLVDNAVKYGGSARIDCVAQAGHVDIVVRDYGPGIPADAIPRMFEPFVRGEQSRSRTTGGTGIGLTIARAQAKLFRGEIALGNHPRGGLVARIRIPAALGTNPQQTMTDAAIDAAVR